MFWPVKVVVAVPKVKFGIMAKPSTRITTVETAMIVVPKLFVRDCTTSMASENTACVRPLGRPKRMSWNKSAFVGHRVRHVMCNTSRIKSRRTRHRMPETACEMMVAHAAPETPILKPATNQISRPMFMPHATSRKMSGMTESPRPRRMPEIML